MEDVMRQKLALIVIFAVASLGLASAQGGAALPTPTPCPNPKPPCPPSETNDAKSVLACEWLDPNSISHMVEALKLYIDNNKMNANAVLSKLEEGDHCNKNRDKSLYEAALGYPDKNGEPTTRARPDILDILATANTRNTDDMNEGAEKTLFTDTETLIKKIHNSGDTGARALAEIDSNYKDFPHLAIYKLLNAVPVPKCVNDTPAARATYVQDLETLRAACEKNRDKVFKLVTKEVFPAAKQKTDN
jgi:hypothetical protein